MLHYLPVKSKATASLTASNRTSEIHFETSFRSLPQNLDAATLRLEHSYQMHISKFSISSLGILLNIAVHRKFVSRSKHGLFDRSSTFTTVLAGRHASSQIYILIDGFGHPTPRPSY